MSSPMQASAEHRFLINLCLKHLVPFFWQGPGLLLIGRVGLSLILDDLNRQEIAILGLDGFDLEGSVVHPRLDLVYDADRLPGFPSPQHIVAVWPDDVWVDVTVGGDCGLGTGVVAAGTAD